MARKNRTPEENARREYNGPVISDHGSKKYREHGKIQ